MNLSDYQQEAATTAIYPEMGTGSVTALAYCALGLGEAGELQGKVKKILRDDCSVVSTEKREAIAAELGDVLWYVAMLASELGYSLDGIAEANLAKLASRQERNKIGGSGDNR